MCNVIMVRFELLLCLYFFKKKKIVFKEEKFIILKLEFSGFKFVVWKCVILIFDVKIVLYNLESFFIY